MVREVEKEGEKTVGFWDSHVTTTGNGVPIITILTVARTEQALLAEIDQMAVRLEERHAE